MIYGNKSIPIGIQMTEKQITAEKKHDQIIRKARKISEKTMIDIKSSSGDLSTDGNGRLYPQISEENLLSGNLKMTEREKTIMTILTVSEEGMLPEVKKAAMEELERMVHLSAMKSVHIMHDMLVDRRIDPEIRKQIGTEFMNRIMGMPTQVAKIQSDSRVAVFSMTSTEKMNEHYNTYNNVKTMNKDNTQFIPEKAEKTGED